MIPSLNIDHAIPSISLSDDIHQVLDIMDEFKVFHLAVVEEGDYLGYVSEELLLDSSAEKINDVIIAGKDYFTTNSEPLYDSVKKLTKANMSTLAVLGKENEFLGCLSIHSISKSLAEISAVRSNGGVFSLIMKQSDYSLSEISRIVENNGFKILSVEILTVVDEPLKMELVVKVNTRELSILYASFERFGYFINLKFGDNIQDNDDKDRLEQFLNYLDL